MKQKKELTVGIVGGKGKMGSWFENFFSDHGFKVLISDKETEITNEELVQESDVVLFSVPIDVTEDVIEELTDLSRKDQLWMDTTSVKTGAVESMLKSKAEVLGMHPMFGPMINTLRNQTIIFCDARLDRWKGWMQDLITESGGKVKFTTANEHDRMMAIIQGLTHFSLISLGYAFKDLGLDLDESLAYTSPIYKIRLDMVGRILNQDAKLYADIEILNPETQKAMREYIQSTMKLYMIVKDKDIESFEKYFNEAADYFGDHKTRAMDESRMLIEKMVEMEKNSQ